MSRREHRSLFWSSHTCDTVSAKGRVVNKHNLPDWRRQSSKHPPLPQPRVGAWLHRQRKATVALLDSTHCDESRSSTGPAAFNRVGNQLSDDPGSGDDTSTRPVRIRFRRKLILFAGFSRNNPNFCRVVGCEKLSWFCLITVCLSGRDFLLVTKIAS